MELHASGTICDFDEHQYHRRQCHPCPWVNRCPA